VKAKRGAAKPMRRYGVRKTRTAQSPLCTDDPAPLKGRSRDRTYGATRTPNQTDAFPRACSHRFCDG
jgi:hypothetical protein